MEALKPNIDIDNFFDRLVTTEQRVLLLDYDGTLAPFRRERDRAFPYEGVPKLLDEIINSGQTRVGIISGRSIEDLTPLLKLKRNPEIWGSHGWEHLDITGKYTAFELEEDMIQGFIEAETWLKKEGYGKRAESKHGCVAIHWRGLSDTEITSFKSSIVNTLTPMAERYSLELRNFDGGMELRAPGMDKGLVVQKILSESAKAVVCYLGDDLTDEDAFRALGSKGLSVLVNLDKRLTSADLWLRPPDELLDFLHRWETSGRR